MARLVQPARGALEAFASANMGELEIVGRQCKLKKPPKTQVPSFSVNGQFVAYASPDSTYAVTKERIDAARRSILIGIYDFTAKYMRDVLTQALRRGVKVTLMLDLDNRTGETGIYEDLKRLGCECVPAPSCASKNARYFASSHEKVIVIDGEWTLVQSGNYSENSIPLNEGDGQARTGRWVPGNRDMGVAVRSRPVADFFSAVLRGDIRLERGATTEAAERFKSGPEAELFQPAPKHMPSQLFASKRLNPAGQVRIQPVLSPDNYMSVIPTWLRAARRSIDIEQQYIRTAQSAIGDLLTAIQEAVDERGVRVRVILAQPFSCASEKCGRAFNKAREEIRSLSEYGLKLGAHVRILDPEQFVHCHNKLLIVDGTAVLVSSQNWSDSAVTKNREAGLLMHSPDLARYYGRIFEHDWTTALSNVRQRKKAKFGPEAFATGKVVPLNWGDYAEV
jgi:phosphatidylserine/phosphatidylglycerophosphate/cardiolipin synthase-like enzyme